MTIEAVPDTAPVLATPADATDAGAPAARAPRARRPLVRRVSDAAVPVVGTLVVAAAVEALVRSGVIDERLLSPPTEIVRTLFEEMGGGVFWSALGNSLRGWATGLLLAVVVPSSVEPSNICTVLPAGAVPVKVGVLSLVMPSPTTPLSAENEVIVGVDPIVVPCVSTVTVRAAEAALVLPATSVALAVKLWAPSLTGAVV